MVIHIKAKTKWKHLSAFPGNSSRSGREKRQALNKITFIGEVNKELEKMFILYFFKNRFYKLKCSLFLENKNSFDNDLTIKFHLLRL